MLVTFVGHGLVTSVVVADRPSCGHGRAAGERGRRGMTGGAAVSARERGRARARAGRVARSRVLLGCGRERLRAGGPRCWAEPEEKRSRSELRFYFFSFSKI
jgi:hypothetical protein